MRPAVGGELCRGTTAAEGKDRPDPPAPRTRGVAHYRERGVDPREKHLVFSDGLDVPKALSIYDRFAGRARLSFGIGTNLANDLGHDPLSIVIKMTACDGRPVAKISDAAGKTMCRDPAYLAHLRAVFDVPEAA